MGLRESLQNLMPKVITALGTLSVDAVYHQVGTSTYDPSTGLSVIINSSVIPIKCIITEYSEEELKVTSTKSEIFQTDKKILIAAVDIPGVVPKMTDYLVTNLETYKIVSKSIDPAEAMWQLQGRA